jgi:hypothetical protein
VRNHQDPAPRREDSVRIPGLAPSRAFPRVVLDIVYVAAILALTALVALLAKGVQKL